MKEKYNINYNMSSQERYYRDLMERLKHLKFMKRLREKQLEVQK